MSVDGISSTLTSYLAQIASSTSNSSANSSSSSAASFSQKPDESALYGKVDTDGDGAVSESEFMSFIKDIQSKDQESGMDTDLAGMTEEELSALYADGDTDGDGSLSLDEFSAIGESLRPEMPEGGMPPPPSGSESTAGTSSTASGIDIGALLEAISSSSDSGETDSTDLYAYLSELIANSYGTGTASTISTGTTQSLLDATA